MRNSTIILLHTIQLILIVFIFGVLHQYSSKTPITTTDDKLFLKVKESMEKAYFEGQKDCLQNNVRISITTLNGDTCYQWTKSCWEEGTKMSYIPECNILIK